jgi:hypothetical protein
VSYLEAITKIIAALAWPVAIVSLSCILRSGILNVLNRFAAHVARLKTARVPGIIQATFDVPKFPPPIPPINVKEIE